MENGIYNGYINAENFYRKVIENVGHHRWDTKTLIKQQMEKLFPEQQEIQNAYSVKNQFTNLVSYYVEQLTKLQVKS